MAIDQGLLARLRFLVVEDQGFQRWVIGQTLEGMGAIKVFSAADGQAALEILETLEPPIDVVVTDLNMPGMDGLEFIRHVAESGRPVCLIVASEQDSSLIASVATMARAYGMTLLDTMAKPVTAKKLRAALDRIEPPTATPVAAVPAPTAEEVREAIERDEIEPFFQAKVSVDTGDVHGAEALARWRHERHGTIMPSAFIPVLESTGCIEALTMRMLAKSAHACGEWRKAGFDMTVSVNVSVVCLEQTGAADRILEAVAAQQLEARHVLLEVTETAAGGHPGRLIENLSRLRMRGFGLSIDDFGTGYSSMQQLTRVPFTELKIDQSFVRHAASNAAARAVLESSLGVARKLALPAVAEGVESKVELNLLRELGCTLAQGYYIARPMAADRFMDWLLESRRRMRTA